MNLIGSALAAVLAMIAPHDAVRQQGLTYADHARGQADVYLPRRPQPGAPVIVFLYGGNWDSGDRGFYRFVGQTFASAGWVTVIPDYRVYPEARYPTFLRDNAQAVRWARDNAAQWGADPDRLFLIGHSAGAYEAVMLAVDGRWLGEVGLRRSDIAGVVGLSGPYDFLPLQSERLNEIFGPRPEQPSTQPINHVDGRAPPMLLLHGAADTVVYPRNTTRMAAAVREAGGEVTGHILPRLDHARLLAAILPPMRRSGPVFESIRTFIAARPARARLDRAA